VITTNVEELDGFEGFSYGGRFSLNLAESVIGGNTAPGASRPVVLIDRDNVFGPIGLSLNPTFASFEGTINDPPAGSGIPPFPHQFKFILGVILPGTMRLDYEYNIMIRPNPGILLGDVDGDNYVTLIDLILLAKHLRWPTDDRYKLENPAAAIIAERDIYPDRTVPGTADLNALALYFAQRASLN